MTATVNEIDLTELIDFEADVACESPMGCDHAADWKVTVGCCGHMWLLCTLCKNETVLFINFVKASRGYKIKCTFCGKDDVPPDVFIFAIDPL